MKKKLYIILGFILVALFSNEKIQAQESKPGILPDTLQVSLLTCGPGTEVYELFGPIIQIIVRILETAETRRFRLCFQLWHV